MISPEKLPNALYALQGVLIRARSMAHRSEPIEELAELLDYAEYMPGLVACAADETVQFRAILETVAAKYRCASVLQRFDEPVPSNW